MPLRSGRPVVVTLHDATVFTDPEHHSTGRGPFFRSAIRTSLRRAARCIVPSTATRDELVRVAEADPAQLDIAPHGVDPRAFHVPSESEQRRVQARLGIADAPYVAFLSTLEPRKNVPGLVRGWVRACEGRERAACPGAGRRLRLGRRDRPGARRGAAAPARGAARLPALPGPAGLPRRRRRRRLPVVRRGLRPDGAGGDGLRRRGAHQPPARAARGGRRRGRLHRDRPRLDRRVAVGAARRPVAARAAVRGGGRARAAVHLGSAAPTPTWRATPAPSPTREALPRPGRRLRHPAVAVVDGRPAQAARAAAAGPLAARRRRRAGHLGRARRAGVAAARARRCARRSPRSRGCGPTGSSSSRRAATRCPPSRSAAPSIAAADPDAVVAVLTADHLIEPLEEFASDPGAARSPWRRRATTRW